MSSPTVVLVHGGFVDGSGWRGVYDALTADGYRTVIVQNPPTLSLGRCRRHPLGARRHRGPVVLVGHSHGGAAISICRPAAGKPEIVRTTARTRNCRHRE
jgi:pimeloyl-ACP methyl ester carboxylesterase